MIKEKILEKLNRTLEQCGERDLFQIPPGFEMQLEVPRAEEHGDFATNLALNLAKPNRCSPRDIATSFVEQLADGDGLFAEVEIAGPGFINFVISPSAWFEVLDEIHRLQRVTASTYRWSSLVQIPPVPSMWVTGEEPRLAMPSPAYWRPPAMGWNVNTI